MPNECFAYQTMNVSSSNLLIFIRAIDSLKLHLKKWCVCVCVLILCRLKMQIAPPLLCVSIWVNVNSRCRRLRNVFAFKRKHRPNHHCCNECYTLTSFPHLRVRQYKIQWAKHTTITCNAAKIFSFIFIRHKHKLFRYVCMCWRHADQIKQMPTEKKE